MLAGYYFQLVVEKVNVYLKMFAIRRKSASG